MPALATSTSTGPSSSSTAVNAASTAAASVTSHCDAEQPLGRAAAAVGDRDPVALLGERLRDGQADAAVAPGHQHGAGHCSPLRMVSTDASEPRRYRQVSANGSRVTPGYDTRDQPLVARLWRVPARSLPVVNRHPIAVALRALRQTLLGRTPRPAGRCWPAGPGWPATPPRPGCSPRSASSWITLTVESDWGLPTPIAVLFAAMTVAPLLALPRRPLLAWRLTVLALLVCTFNAPADQAWPWNPAAGARVGRWCWRWSSRGSIGRCWSGWWRSAWCRCSPWSTPGNRGAVWLLLGALAIVGDLIRRNRLSRRALAAQTELSEREQERARGAGGARPDRPRDARRGGAPHVADRGAGRDRAVPADRTCRRRPPPSSSPSPARPATR